MTEKDFHVNGLGTGTTGLILTVLFAKAKDPVAVFVVSMFFMLIYSGLARYYMIALQEAFTALYLFLIPIGVLFPITSIAPGFGFKIQELLVAYWLIYPAILILLSLRKIQMR